MGKIKPYPPVKYFAAITFTAGNYLVDLYGALENLFSAIDHKSEIFDFDQFTSYYQSEMGKSLQKQIISFKTLLPAEQLPALKIATNSIEENFLLNGKRTINVDPGYLTAARMVLATTKDYDHRIYLGMGIFGDLHYRFRSGHFRFNEWTYPDYQQENILHYFEELRILYMEQLKSWNAHSPQNEES
jgi:hypothetical protein